MLKKLSTVVGLVLLSGCVHVSVSDGKRTQSTAYDGLWQGEITGTEPKQIAGHWELTCGEVNLNLVTQVNSGVISGYLRENENITFTTNVNDNGRFYARISKEETSYRETAGSDLSLNGREFFVFRGRLDPQNNNGKGQFVLASDQLGMGGCTTPVKFIRS